MTHVSDLYKDNKFMRMVYDKMNDFEDLYYDHEDFKKMSAFHQGYDEGKKENQLEIAKNLLSMGIDLSKISEATHVTIEELKQIKLSIN